MGFFIHAVLRKWHRVALLAVACVWVLSCATTAVKSATSSSGQISAHLETSLNELTSNSVTTASFTLDQVVSIAFAKNPTFAEYEANRAVAQAAILQALAYPNPEIEIGMGIAKARGSSEERGIEYQIGVTQPIELPGKRRTRRLAAEAGVAVAEKDRDVFRATLRAEVTKAYYRIIYQSEAASLAETQRQLLDEFQQIVQKRVEGGEAADPDLIKTRVETIKARRQAQVHRRQLAAARIALNALCGGTLPQNYELTDSLSAFQPPMRFEDAYSLVLSSHPVILRLEAEESQKEAIIAREQAAWWPDLKPGISAGRELDKEGISVSLGVEVPLWGRNRGGIATARAELLKTQTKLSIARQEIERDLRTASEDYQNAREQQAAFEGGLREAATEALRVETVLYQQGETDLWRLLDSRRTAQETEAEYLQALYDATVARAELERSIGIVEPEIFPPNTITHSEKGANP